MERQITECLRYLYLVEQAWEKELRWIPLYCRECGPFDEGALPHWTMVRFLHEQMGVSLTDIADLKPVAAA